MSGRLHQSIFLQLIFSLDFSKNSIYSAISLKKSDIAEEVESFTSPINPLRTATFWNHDFSKKNFLYFLNL